MKLEYGGKQSTNHILNKEYVHKYSQTNSNSLNKLFFADNFDALQILINELGYKEKIDLIYIDPPFSTRNIFHVGNTISSSSNDVIAYEDTLYGDKYLEFIHERLVLLYGLLKPTGSLYFHIDYKIGHYIKIILDEIFGLDNFRGDISRVKCNPKNFKRKAYGNIKDMVLFYTKSDNYTWNYPTVPFSEEDIEKSYKKVDSDGRRYTTVPIHAPGETKNGVTGGKWMGMYPPKGRHWRCSPKKLDELNEKGLIEWSKNGNPRKKNYADEMKEKGKPMQDIWFDYKDKQKPIYPTEKNMSMVENIIETSSNQGDLVLDCFAGSGTTLIASENCGRNWIGVDDSIQSINIIQDRLKDSSYDFIEINY